MGRIETGVELLASALFAGAVAFAAFTLLGRGLVPSQGALLAAAAGAGAFFLSTLTFRHAGAGDAHFPAAAFEPAEFAPFERDELVLGETDRLAPDELVLTEADRVALEPLVLDDVLAELEPDSRVVRLFDRKAMPTPGQLQSRIEDHLGGRQSTPHDASQALSEALAELRRSLR